MLPALLIGTMSLLPGCARESPAPADRTAETGASPAASQSWRRGTVRFAASGGWWRPCDGGAEGLLVDPTGALRQAVALVSGDRDAYAELALVEGDAPDSGSPGGRRTAFMVTAINRITPDSEGGGCGREPGAFLIRASGNEPFWAVEVTRDSVVFMQPDAPSRLAWAAPAPLVREGARTWAYVAAGQPALNFEITPQPCRDSMSGATSSWSAVAVLDGRSLRGCAYEGLGGVADHGPRKETP